MVKQFQVGKRYRNKHGGDTEYLCVGVHDVNGRHWGVVTWGTNLCATINPENYQIVPPKPRTGELMLLKSHQPGRMDMYAPVGSELSHWKNDSKYEILHVKWTEVLNDQGTSEDVKNKAG